MLINANADATTMSDEAVVDGRMLRAIVNNAVDAILVIDATGIVQMANPATERLFGYPLDRLLGENVKLLMPEPYRASHDDYLRRYLDTGQRRIIGIGREVLGRRNDGSIFPMYLSVAEVCNGEQHYFAGIVHDLSAQKGIENALRESRRSLDTLMSNVPGMVYRCRDDPQRIMEFVSEGAMQLTGFGPADLTVGGPVSYTTLVHPDDRHSVWSQIQAALEQRQPYELNYRIRTKAGEEKWVWEHGRGVHADDGRLIALEGLMRDISERRRAEERLRQSEAYMRLTLENAPIGIASADLAGKLLDVNPMFAELLGYRRDELVGMSVDDITHPEDRADTRSHFEALVRGDISRYELEKRYLHKDGGVIQVRARAGLIRDAVGGPMRVVGQVEDETERYEAARELRRMRAYLKNILDSMPSLLVGVDTEGRVTEWNRSAQRSTGITAGEALGREFRALFPELAAQALHISQAIRDHRPIHTERLPIKKNGETRYADFMVYPLLANGALGAVIRMDDITERIRIEQMMVQTEKMLSVGGLAAGMAHEISNPLSILLQSAQNLRRRLSKELPANRTTAEALGLDLDILSRYLDERGVVEFIEDIQEAGARASRIVADMLAFSRRSSSRLIPNRLDEMLETAVRLAGSDYDLKKKFDFRQIEIVRDYDPRLGEVCCDRTQIEQVILNLVKNSAHAMADAGTPPPRRIRLHTSRDDDFACIEVEDNGPGMDEITRKRAFEPFFTTKEIGVGTGLGLSVSYFIITEQHKGSIRATSREGKGCRFTIRLPIAPIQERV
jgi:PAS domain S-box-containing protein